MGVDVPNSDLSPHELARLALFDRALADALDAALTTSGGGGGTVHTDGTTVTGDGSAGSPLTVIGGTGTVHTDGTTITGDGSEGSPLVGIAQSVSVDGATVFGNGTAGSPLVATTSGTDTAEIFNVVLYGADPTGAANSSTGIRAALAAAWARVQVTGRKAIVYFPGGYYKAQTRDTFYAIDVNAMHDISFVGSPAGRSVVELNGNAGTANWHLFAVRNNAHDIVFRDLILNMNITNPNGTQQNHLVQLGTGNGLNTGCNNVDFINCKFTNSVGDGVRLLGDFGGLVTDVTINACKFNGCLRASVSFQRWVQRVQITACRFAGGTDQQIDFEPTGYSLTANTGSSSTTLNLSTAKFVSWGISVGDPIYNISEDTYALVTGVISETQITTTPVTDWSSDIFYFPLHNSQHLIANNHLVVGSNANGLLLTLSGTYKTTVSNNQIQGCIQGQDVTDCIINGNAILTSSTDGINQPAITLIKSTHGTQVVGNSIVVRQTTYTVGRAGIEVYDQASRRPYSVLIADNVIRMETRGIGIYCGSALHATITNNRIALFTPGDTGQSAGINCRAVSFDTDSLTITGNQIYALAGGGSFSDGVLLGATAFNIKQVVVGGGVINDATNPITFSESSGGLFLNPPVISPLAIGSGVGNSPVVPPNSKNWVVLAGAGGASVFTNSWKPAVYFGTGSPEGVLTAGVGSIAMRRDGTGGAVTYVKGSGTGNTGWLPIGGVPATGTINCVAKASMADTDFMTIADGVQAPVLYEFDTAGDGVTVGRTQVNISAATTATDVATALAAAIAAKQPLLSVSQASGVLTLTHKIAGTFANVSITENVGNAGFTVAGMSGGVNPAR